MKTLRWKFGDYLKAHSITAYRLSKELGGTASRRLPYEWAKGPPQHLHLDVLQKVMAALEDITGKPVSVCDLLEYEEGGRE